MVEVQVWALVWELMYGTNTKARAALEALQHLLAPGTASPFASTLASAWIALYHLSMGRIDDGRAAALAGLEIAASTDCHIHDYHLVHYVHRLGVNRAHFAASIARSEQRSQGKRLSRAFWA